MIFKQYVIGAISTNNYLLIDEETKEAALIDCSGNFEEIAGDLKEYGGILKYILLTHAHFDHIGGTKEFSEKFNIPIFMHKDDEMWINHIKEQCDYYGLPDFEKPQNLKFIDENTKLNLGKNEIKVIHTKGHTKGGLSYLIGNSLFSGDTLFFEEVGRCDLPGGDFDEIKKSIKEKLFTLDLNTNVYPGHGDFTTIKHEVIHNPYFENDSL